VDEKDQGRWRCLAEELADPPIAAPTRSLVMKVFMVVFCV
jgi:hypothetical protein